MNQLPLEKFSGCKSRFLSEGLTIDYEVTFSDPVLKFVVPMPPRAVDSHLILLEKFDEFSSLDAIGKAIQGYQIRPVDALAYALHSFDKIPVTAQKSILDRLGDDFWPARKLAVPHWLSMFSV